jgi:hypothetical protein
VTSLDFIKFFIGLEKVSKIAILMKEAENSELKEALHSLPSP